MKTNTYDVCPLKHCKPTFDILYCLLHLINHVGRVDLKYHMKDNFKEMTDQYVICAFEA